VETTKLLTTPVMFVALTVMQLFHSVEEVATGLYLWLPRVSGHIRDKFDFIPQLNISRRNFAIGNVIIVVFMVAISMLLFRRVPWAVRVARAAAFVEILNGIGHLAGMIITRRYFPGAFSAIGLIVCGVLFFRADLVERAVSRADER